MSCVLSCGEGLGWVGGCLSYPVPPVLFHSSDEAPVEYVKEGVKKCFITPGDPTGLIHCVSADACVCVWYRQK